MTKQLHKLAHEFQARLLSGGGPHPSQMHPVLRDGWASLVRWHRAGERVWRIEGDAPELADDLPLATAPVHLPGVLYQGPERDEWIIVARHDAEQIIEVTPEERYAYPEPMLTYITEVPKGIAAGCINLDQQPTWRDLYLPAGRSGERWLEQDEIATEEQRFLRALRYFYRPPSIVV